MKIIKYMFLVLLLAPVSAQAATINTWLNPLSSGPLEIGQTTNVEIWGSWDEVLLKGGVALLFDESRVSVTNTTMNIDFQTAPTPLVKPGGLLETIGFLKVFGDYAPGSYKIATVEFQAIGGGVAGLALTAPDYSIPEYLNFRWYAYNGPGKELHYPVYDATATIAVNPVPLPAAAWFMLSGLGFLAFRRKRAA